MSRNPKAKFELVPKSESRSFAVREFILPAFSSPWHFHEEWEPHLDQTRHRAAFRGG